MTGVKKQGLILFFAAAAVLFTMSFMLAGTQKVSAEQGGTALSLTASDNGGKLKIELDGENAASDYQYWVKKSVDIHETEKTGLPSQYQTDGAVVWAALNDGGFTGGECISADSYDLYNVDGYFSFLIREKKQDGGTEYYYFTKAESEVGETITNIKLNGEKPDEVNYLAAGQKCNFEFEGTFTGRVVLENENTGEKLYFSEKTAEYTVEQGIYNLKVYLENSQKTQKIRINGYNANYEYTKITGVSVRDAAAFGENYPLGLTAEFLVTTATIGSVAAPDIIIETNGLVNGNTVTYASAGVYSFTVKLVNGLGIVEDYYTGYYNAGSGSVPALSADKTGAEGEYTISATDCNIPDAEYQFVKWDAKGEYVVKNYSTENSLNIKLFGYGNYRFEVRAKSPSAGSFEVRKFVDIDYHSPALADTSFSIQEIGKTNTISVVSAQKPYRVSVAAVDDALLYKFIVSTAGQWRVEEYFSPENSFVWIPNKTGSYTIEVRILSSGNNGYADLVNTFPVSVIAGTFKFNAKDVEYSSSVAIDKAELYENQTDITFTYEIKDSTDSSKSFVYTEQTDTITFNPGMSNLFTVTARAYYKGQFAGEKQSNFKVFDNVLAWTVNEDNLYTDIVLGGHYNVNYTESNKYGSDLGSTFIENTEANSGVILMDLYSMPNILAGSTLEFYVYNPTGEVLYVDVFTTSGWWTNLGLNVLTNSVEIPAAIGWHKVSLTFKAAFDGTLSGMTGAGITADAQTMIRITTQTWGWRGVEHFGVNLTNIYLVKQASAYGIDYATEGFIDTGMQFAEFKLPEPTAVDGRITFEYSLKQGTTDVEFDDQSFKFTPTADGGYTFTINAYFRGELIDTKNVDFTITEEVAIALTVAPYYTYNAADGIVTLPKATLGTSQTGKTVRYSVKLGSGAETVLGEDMKFNTGKVNGDYTYKAELMDGVTAVETVQKTLKIHGANVLIGLGRDASLVNGTLSHNIGTTFTYTTAKAAPGETGSALINNDGHTFGEKGNINIQLGHTDIANVSMITFWIYHTVEYNLDCVIYSKPSLMFTDYWYNGTRYTNWERAIAPQNGWQKIEVIVGGHNVGGADIRLQFTSSTTYDWTDEPAEIYISNIYYS